MKNVTGTDVGERKKKGKKWKNINYHFEIMCVV